MASRVTSTSYPKLQKYKNCGECGLNVIVAIVFLLLCLLMLYDYSRKICLPAAVVHVP